jgi:hypothetical protein
MKNMGDLKLRHPEKSGKPESRSHEKPRGSYCGAVKDPEKPNRGILKNPENLNRGAMKNPGDLTAAP